MQESSNQKQRESNFELLRIISMIMIIFSHIAVHSNFLFDPNVFSFNRLFIEFIHMGGKLGVNIFILISGYFLINSTFKKEKAIKLALETLFYSLSIVIIASLFKQMDLNLSNIIIYILPLTHKVWWFMTYYMILYLLSPFINKMLHSLNKDEHKKLIIILLLLFSIIPTFISGAKTYTSDLGWFIALYVTAAYIRLYGLPIDKWSTKRCLLITILLVVLNFSLVVLGHYLLKIGITRFGNPNDLYGMYRILTLLISLGIFICFKRINIPNNQTINQIASTTLGIYLIHDHPMIRFLLWVKLFKNSQYVESPMLPLLAILECIAVLGGCYLIETVRQYIFKNFERMIVKEKAKL